MNDFFAVEPQQAPGWLCEAGPQSDVAIATGARLARNLGSIPFPHHASDLELGTALADLTRRLSRLPALADGWSWSLADLTANQRRTLLEKQLASRTLIDHPTGRGLMAARDLTRVAAINDEDHLRLSAQAAGFNPHEAVAAVLAFDDEVEAEVAAAFSSEWGYLAASPTDVGTGLHLSALLHLPGLSLVGEIDKVLNALRHLQFSVGGLHGEGQSVRGAMFRVTNLVTLGRDEAEIAEDFRTHVGKIITYERSARHQLHERDPLWLEDLVHRSRATMANARLITTQEAFDCLSHLRLGVALGLLPPVMPGRLNRLLVRMQTGHLELAAGRTLDGRAKPAARAVLLREFFAEEADNPS